MAEPASVPDFTSSHGQHPRRDSLRRARTGCHQTRCAPASLRSPVVGNGEPRGARRHPGFDHVVAGAWTACRNEIVAVERGRLVVEHVEYLELEVELVFGPAGLVIHAQVDVVNPWRVFGPVWRNCITRSDGHAATEVVLAAYAVRELLVRPVRAAAQPWRAGGNPYVGTHDPVWTDGIRTVELERVLAVGAQDPVRIVHDPGIRPHCGEVSHVPARLVHGPDRTSVVAVQLREHVVDLAEIGRAHV